MGEPTAILLVNFRGARDTIECLETLAACALPDTFVAIVENGSKDASEQEILAWTSGPGCAERRARAGGEAASECARLTPEEALAWPEGRRPPPLALIVSERNLGFAGGNNLGARFALRAGARYVVLLNNDTLVTPGFLEPLLEAARSDARIGLVGGRIHYHARPELIWAAGGGSVRPCTGGVEHALLDERESARSRAPFDVDYVTGCLLLIKAEVVAAIGYMDEAYFLYYEEVDWAVRARRAGFRCVYAPASKIYHKVSASTGGDTPLCRYYVTRNRLYFVRKHLVGARRLAATALLLAHGGARLLYHALRRNTGNARVLWRAMRDALAGRMGAM